MACYQCPEDETLDEIRARRKAQIREYVDQQIAEADAALIASGKVPLANFSPEDDVRGIPEEENAPVMPTVLHHPEITDATSAHAEAELTTKARQKRS